MGDYTRNKKKKIMKTLLIISAIIFELTVYGFVYYLGYKRGKDESDIMKQKIEIDVRKLAFNR